MAVRRRRTEDRSEQAPGALLASLVPGLGRLMNLQASDISVLGEMFYHLDELTAHQLVPPHLHASIAGGRVACDRLTKLFIEQQRLLGYRA